VDLSRSTHTPVDHVVEGPIYLDGYGSGLVLSHNVNAAKISIGEHECEAREADGLKLVDS